jgi:DNA-binding response OmpR family regulator
MPGEHDFTNDLLFIINERQQTTYNDLSEIAFSRGIPESALKEAIMQLEASKRIASRSSGGIMTYYILDEGSQINKVLIVEDDKSISKLMAITIGKGFEVSQIYDGGEAMSFIRKNRPDLVVLDLMLPNKNGLDICQTIKSDPELSNTIVILVSAMDPTSNRFKGLEYGADYYVRKPFDPGEIRTLVTIFLRKKGKRFDALIDLPDEERISKEIERSIKENGEYVIGTLSIDNLGVYARRFGNQSAMVILRLVSQLLQDIIRTKTKGAFVGFLNNTEFVIAGMKENVENLVKEVSGEFDAVMPFILQDAGFKSINLSDIENLFDSNKEIPKLSIRFAQSEKEKLKERRDAILKDKGVPATNLGSYTYEELEKLFSDQNLDIKITRDPTGVRLQVGRKG